MRFSVDIAMMKIARTPDQLYSLGLGSCVGVAIYDPAIKIGGLIHVLLPSIKEMGGEGQLRSKYADSGIYDLVNMLVNAGASKIRLKAKMAGGAAMFAVKSTAPGETIGRRNVLSCKETLKGLGIELLAQDVGGGKGRTILFDVETSALTIKIIDREDKVI